MKVLNISLAMVCLLLFLTGCWDRYEIEERGNILGVAVDLLEDLDEEEYAHLVEPSVTHTEDFPVEEKKIKLTTQIALPGRIPLGPSNGDAGSSEDTVWVVEVIGNTLNDAMQNLQQELSQKLYLGHLQLVILSEGVARDGLGEINDYLRRNNEVRRTAWMLVNGDNAGETLKTAPPVSQVPSLFLSQTLDNAVRMGKLPKQYIGHFWIARSRKGREGYLPYIQVVKGENILIDGLAYFKGDKMVGNTLPLEIGMFMGIKGENPSGYRVSVPLPDSDNDTVMLRVDHRDSKLDVKNVNGKLRATIDLTITGAIEEKTGSKTEMDSKFVQEIEKAAAKQGKEHVKKFINQIQENKSDIIGIGEFVRGRHSKYWDKNIKTKEKWQEVFADMDVEVDMNINITRPGMRST